MILREAKEDDLDAILEVLRASLGETSSKKTDAVWNYKHVLNPFGKSLVLVAEENDQIIGVRAFMRWEWQRGTQTYSAFRAVDTATHPDHQGKGVFKKLTLKALEVAEERGDYFVFNTPNSQSKPGYLKMGWKELGKIRIGVSPVFSFFNFRNYIDGEKLEDINIVTELLKNHCQNQKSSNRLFTPKTMSFLEWRYLHNELLDYDICYTKNYFVAGYIKERGKFREYRISEFLSIGKQSESEAYRIVKKLAKQRNANFITFSSDILKDRFALRGPFGPVLTLKNINLSHGKNIDISDLKLWNYSLGDLELF